MADSVAKLKKLLQKIAEEQNYAEGRINIKAITSGGANFTTKLYLVTISQPPKPDINMFAKVADLDEKFRADNEMLAKSYMIESQFYTELAVNFERMNEKNNVPSEHRLVIPKYFGEDLTRMEECMVLENLEASGYRNFDRMKTMDWEYAAAAVQQMARFHALGLAFRDESPTEFEGIVSHLGGPHWTQSDVMQVFIALSIKFASDFVGDEHSQKLQKYFANKDVMIKIVENCVNDKKMLIHGDFRPSNLMHRRRNGKLEIIALDYQTIRIGNPVTDLMHFIFSGSDEEFRRYHYQRLLDHYHAELTLSLKRLNVDVEKVYSKKTFEQDLHNHRSLGLTIGPMLVTMVTVAPEDAPNLNELQGKLDEIFKPNKLAQERMVGIVRDYVRWGVL